MRSVSFALACLLSLAATGCGSDRVTAPDITMTQFAPSLGVNLSAMTRTTSGLYYLDQQVGTGAVARAGDSVTVHYTGWLANGTKFDSSRDRNEPIKFKLGAGDVIAGWDKGIAGIKIGGKRKLVIPPQLAYGAAGRGIIPPNSVLVFDVELVGVR